MVTIQDIFFEKRNAFIQIRNNKDINGVVIYNREIKLSVCAGNSNILVINTESLCLIFNICES